MKKSRFMERQIEVILKEAERDIAVTEVLCSYGMCGTTFINQ
jgi:hypothetical protein